MGKDTKLECSIEKQETVKHRTLHDWQIKP